MGRRMMPQVWVVMMIAFMVLVVRRQLVGTAVKFATGIPLACITGIPFITEAAVLLIHSVVILQPVAGEILEEEIVAVEENVVVGEDAAAGENVVVGEDAAAGENVVVGEDAVAGENVMVRIL